jgi:acyl dehydratase
MALNLNIIGKIKENIAFTYNEDIVILYALGIGAGMQELDFIYEKNLKVFPTFAVVPFVPAFVPMIAESQINMLSVLHGEQKIVLHKQIPPSGIFYTNAVCSSIYDKGDKGAILTFNLKTRDKSGQLLFENTAVAVDRSAGNFGGERGPTPEKFDPPTGKDPDFHVEYVTCSNQAALYRLSGDKNPMHIDPDFAMKGGFDRPILHGLSTFGFAGRAILHNTCGSNPARFKSFSARFMGVVFPGDTLITEGWRLDNQTYIVQTKNQDGKIVLGNGLAEIC